MANLTLLIERLVTQRVEFVVVGGLAVMMYGTGLITDDVDICAPLSRQNLDRIAKALGDLRPYHRMTPQRLPFVMKDGVEVGLRNLYLGTDYGDLDILGTVLGVGDYAAMAGRSLPIKMSYGECRLLSLEDLIQAKEAMNRDKDRAAVRLLRGIHSATRTPEDPLP